MPSRRQLLIPSLGLFKNVWCSHGSGAVGREVASNTRVPWSNSQQGQNIFECISQLVNEPPDE